MTRKLKNVSLWHLRFPQLCCWRLKLSGTWQRSFWVDYCRHLKDHDVFIYLCLEMQVTWHDPSEHLQPFTQWIRAQLSPWVIIVASHIAWLYWIATWITDFIKRACIGLLRTVCNCNLLFLHVNCVKLYRHVLYSFQRSLSARTSFIPVSFSSKKNVAHDVTMLSACVCFSSPPNLPSGL